MKWHRIWAILIRSWYGTLRSYDRLVDTFYWVSIDLVLWGITGHYFETASGSAGNFMFMLTGSVILWNITYRSQSDFGVGILEELWNKNMINLFASPLKLNEWLAAICIFSTIKSLVTLSFASTLAYILYSFNVFSFSWHLVPWFIILTISGWGLGLLMVAMILRFTTKVQSLAWTFVWILAPVSAIYFPLNSLPGWAIPISKLVPMSYVFEEMRRYLQFGQVIERNLLIAFLLSLTLLGIGNLLVTLSFKRVLNQGLVKLY